MKRIGIFSFYNKDGIAGDYIDYLLKDLRDQLEMLVVVVNGTVNVQGYAVFQKYADQILIRENKGYDAGAYKDAILTHIGIDVIKEFQQMVLVNDTFYGPFCPFGEIFAVMDQPYVDFWGINYVDDHIAKHIQSYFLVFNGTILKDGGIFDYFNSKINENALEIEDVYADFEVGLFKYLTHKGFRPGSYTKRNDCDSYRSSNYCIKKYGFPVMKKKCFLPVVYRKENIFDALRYLHSHSAYDINLIIRDAGQNYDFPYTIQEILEDHTLPCLEELVPVADISEQEIRSFLHENSAIYIYGVGVIARKISEVFSQDLHHVKGFVVSDSRDIVSPMIRGLRVFHISQIKSSEAAVIVALNRRNTNEVAGSLNLFQEILYLWRQS